MDLLKFSLGLYDNHKLKLINYADQSNIFYCFAHSFKLLDCMLKTIKKYNISHIHLLGNLNKISGVEIIDINKDFYEKNNVQVSVINFDLLTINTKNESDSIVEWLISTNRTYSNIILIAPYFHILRATLTFCSSCIQQDLNINIVPIFDQNCEWDKKYITHQGNTEENLNDLIILELERINRYTEKGDIKCIKEIIKFIN